ENDQRRRASRLGLSGEAQQQQHESKNTPGQRVSHVFRETAPAPAKLQISAGRVKVRDLDVDKNEESNAASSIQKLRQPYPLRPGVGFYPARARGKRRRGNAERVEIPVENGSPTAGVIPPELGVGDEPEKRGGRERGRGLDEAVLRDPKREPGKRGSFQGPGDGDPLFVQENRNGRRDEREANRREEGRGEPTLLLILEDGGGAAQGEKGGSSEHDGRRPERARLPGRFRHYVENGVMNQRGKRRGEPGRSIR